MKDCPWYIPDRLCEMAVEQGKAEARSIVAPFIGVAFVAWLIWSI